MWPFASQWENLGCELEDYAAAVGPADRRGTVKFSVSTEGEIRRGVGTVGAVELVQQLVLPTPVLQGR